MKKTVKLTERDLTKIVKRVMNEWFYAGEPKDDDENSEYYATFGSDSWRDKDNRFYNQEKMDSMKMSNDFEDESFDEYDEFSSKYPNLDKNWFGDDSVEDKREIFKQYKEVGKKGPLRVRRFRK